LHLINSVIKLVLFIHSPSFLTLFCQELTITKLNAEISVRYIYYRFLLQIKIA